MESRLVKGVFSVLMAFALIQGGRMLWSKKHDWFKGPLLDESFVFSVPEGIDTDGGNWWTLSYGYHLAPWPKSFEGDPIVTSMGYQKGPPKKFISEINQIWSPGNAEVFIEGPRTPVSDYRVNQWRSCLESSFCVSDRKAFSDSVFKDLLSHRGELKEASWFQSDHFDGARGVHLRFELQDQDLDRYVVITQLGNTQNFTLKSARNEVGAKARELFKKVIYGMTVRDDILASREWISARLKSVELGKVVKLTDAKDRYLRLIETQNLLFCQLAIDPRTIAPFFHLAGVTHLLGMNLLKETKTYFRNQESWLIGVQPLLTSLIQYVGDFPEASKVDIERNAARANMEALLQDFLLLKKKKSK